MLMMRTMMLVLVVSEDAAVIGKDDDFHFRKIVRSW